MRPPTDHRWTLTPLPLLQAPMAGSQGHALAAAVCSAGGLGAIPAAMLTPQGLDDELSALQARLAVLGCGSAPYNVNFFCHTPPEPDAAHDARWRTALAPYYAELGLDAAQAPAGPGRTPFSAAMAEVLERFQPAVVSFHFGLPAPELLARVQARGALVLSSATTVAEARWLQAHGADAVIAQGLEAGGHRGHFLDDDLGRQSGTFALLPQIVAAVQIPVIAAGGIASAAGVQAVRVLGAAAAQVGSAYLLCPEATTSAVHRAALVAAQVNSTPTALTRLFSGRPARGLVNRLMRELGPLNPIAPAFPGASVALAPLRTAAEAQGLNDFSPLWAGQNLGGCRTVGAAEMTRALCSTGSAKAPDPDASLHA